jgi:guanine deaminase
LITGEEDAVRLTREENGKWPAVDTGDPATALLHVAVVPRFSLSVTPLTLGRLGELYDSVRDRGVYFHSHLNENNRPGTGEIDTTKAVYQVNSYLDTYDGKFLPGSAVGGKSLLGRRSRLCACRALHRRRTCPGWPRPARRSHTARPRSSTSVPARCRGNAPSIPG